MDFYTCPTDSDKQIRKMYAEKKEMEHKLSALNASIRRLRAEKADSSDCQSAKLSDDELLYLIKFSLSENVPATKAFAACTIQFNKESGWAKQVIRYRPLCLQVWRVFERLETAENYLFQLIKEHKLFNEKELLACSSLSGFLNKLKRWSFWARTVEKKDAEIARLNNKVGLLTREVARQEGIIKQVQSMNPKEHAILLRTEHPDMSITAIAKAVGVSRTTIYSYFANEK